MMSLDPASFIPPLPPAQNLEEALAVDNERSGLIILLLGDPHLLHDTE